MPLIFIQIINTVLFEKYARMLKATLEGNSHYKNYHISFYCTNIVYRAINHWKNFGLPHGNMLPGESRGTDLQAHSMQSG